MLNVMDTDRLLWVEVATLYSDPATGGFCISVKPLPALTVTQLPMVARPNMKSLALLVVTETFGVRLATPPLLLLAGNPPFESNGDTVLAPDTPNTVSPSYVVPDVDTVMESEESGLLAIA